MAATSVVVTAVSTRVAVMEQIWNRIFDFFEAGEYEKAECAFKYYTRLEEMSDDEYLSTCECGKAECPCAT